MSEVERENPLRQEKRKKLQDLKDQGLDPFPHAYERTHKVKDIVEKYSSLQTGEKSDSKVVLAGRLMTRRDMGKAAFFNFQDQSGSLQGYIKLEELDPESQKFFNHIDIGDFIGIAGFPFRTKKGELSVHAQKFQIL